jgi:hypothetical protein
MMRYPDGATMCPTFLQNTIWIVGIDWYRRVSSTMLLNLDPTENRLFEIDHFCTCSVTFKLICYQIVKGLFIGQKLVCLIYERLKFVPYFRNLTQIDSCPLE